VPIERELLGGRLGESNEPFLNKPARYKELSTENAVRRGNDTLILNAAIAVLSSLRSSDEALVALKDCLYWVFKRESRDLNDFLTGGDGTFYQSSLVSFARRLLHKSHEGETSAILSGTAFSLLGTLTNRDFLVKTHKVNQAGSSSNEVSDIDVYEDNRLVYAAEVKDKIFTSQDVEHAISKTAQSGHKSILFLKGPRASLVSGSEEELINLWEEKGFNLYFVSVLDYFVAIVSVSQVSSPEDFMQIVNMHADLAKVKDQTFSYIGECVTAQGW